MLEACANVDSNKVRVRMEQGLTALEANRTGLGMKMEVCWWSRKKIRTRELSYGGGQVQGGSCPREESPAVVAWS